MAAQNGRITKPIKILMLHGYTQSGPIFRTKTRALEKNLQKFFPQLSLHYITAPIRLHKADIPNWEDPNLSSFSAEPADRQADEEELDSFGWWRRKGAAEPYTYEGIEMGLECVAEALRQEGPFDGVIGFSQGGALSGMVASLLESDRQTAFEKQQPNGGMRYPSSFEQDTGFIAETIHAPLKFAVSYSGFAASTHPLYAAFYEPKIKTPMLHFLGSVDTVVEEKRSLRLVEACAEGAGKDDRRVVYHPGGHFLPSSQKQYVAPLISFIQEIMGDKVERKEESAEDMDVPF